jgi:hypothetical protein
VAKLFSGGCRGTGATLIGARVTGVGATSGFSVEGGTAWRVQGADGAESVVSSVGGGGGGGGSGGAGGAFVGVGCALGAGCALVDACGAIDVDSSGALWVLPRNASMTSGTATTADATAIMAIVACLVRYHGAAGGRNVSVLVSEARS